MSMFIPQEALPYIFFQRTAYLNDKPLKRFLDVVSARIPFLYKLNVNFLTTIYAQEFKDSFSKDMQEEFSQILPSLPSSMTSLLDIGCGVAGFEVVLNQHFKNSVDNYLLDKTATDKTIYYKFEKRGSFYNSLETAKHLLTANSVPETKIHLQEATPDNKILLSATSIDVVISLISWCFHYPAETYLDEVCRVLKPGGILIVDVRKGTDGEERIRAKLTYQKTIHEDKKMKRLCFLKT